ncbi:MULTISPECIES: hypothetical protein [unclassified Paenibacillus]|uniref:hypothetical protein n=1 Tax=unclassified Paenibacillus TaxID=185978 RepID=UPI0003E218B7|nr:MULTISPECIES: hypothetical protein [unclassified Paenibacillus]ETT45179.1 hypothetical protein C162_21618 [Paenibacillus sp. FSL R7-269]OMF90368.1 hypothetical protein BK147_23550 [Paenibacillus sp. FSL R7-0337]
MNWNWLLLLFLLITALMQLPRLIRLRSPQDTTIFCTLWLLAASITIADMAGSTLIRPLDWVNGIIKLLSL